MTRADDKAEVRAGLRDARRQRTDADREAAASALGERVSELLTSLPSTGPLLVACYLSLPHEPGTEPAIAALRARGHAVWVPRITGRDLDWVHLTPQSTLEPGPLGILQPTGAAVPPEELTGLDLVLVPGLAGDRAGNRLGQGGGYYDRFLADLPRHDDGGPLRALMLFDRELLDEVPHERHDQRVDVAVQPTGITWLRG